MADPLPMAADPLPGAAGRNYRVGPGTPILPVALAGIGAYLAWFGVHYWMSDVKWPSDPIKAVLTGKPMPDNAAVSGAASLGGLGSFLGDTMGPLGSSIAPNAAQTSQISAAALRYQGKGYVFGGPADVPGDWDCSSFVSYVLGKDLGLVLPGGGRFGDPGYPPHAHGPGSTAYMLYGLGIDRSQVQAGDLIVSVEHIGIAISNSQMISAQQPSTGTRVSGFPDGFPAGPPVYRRVPVNLFHAG